MDFDCMSDGTVVPDMSVNDLPDDVVICLLNSHGSYGLRVPPHIAVGSIQSRRRWEYRLCIDALGSLHRWQTWRHADTGWYTSHGSLITRGEAHWIITNNSPVHPLLRLPDGL